MPLNRCVLRRSQLASERRRARGVILAEPQRTVRPPISLRPLRQSLSLTIAAQNFKAPPSAVGKIIIISSRYSRDSPLSTVLMPMPTARRRSVFVGALYCYAAFSVITDRQPP